MNPSREGHAVTFLSSDYQSITKKIFTKFQEKMFNCPQEKEKREKKTPQKMGKITQQVRIFQWLQSPQQCLKSPYANFQKNIFSHSQEMVKHTEKQTNTQTNKQTYLID